MGNPFNIFRPKVTHQTTQVNKTNPYDDKWIRDKFTGAEQQYAQGQSQIDELTKFMNERKAALARPQTVSIGGQNVRQDQLGNYLQNQINTKASDLNRQLVEYQTGIDQSIGRLGQQQSAARDSLKSTYDARLADISAAAGLRDQRLADITAAAGANEQALRAQSEALVQQSERARAGQAANQAAIQAATSQYQAGQQANQAAIRAQQEQMAQQTQAARAAQEQNQMTAGVKADLKPVNKYRFGTAGSFNRAGLRISTLNI